MFLDLVQQLTGQPLRADAWVDHLQRPLPQLLEEEHTAYEEAIKTGPRCVIRASQVCSASQAQVDVRACITGMPMCWHVCALWVGVRRCAINSNTHAQQTSPGRIGQ